jgi:hypothetical protein
MIGFDYAPPSFRPLIVIRTPPMTERFRVSCGGQQH